jgi:signal transduction histidine kinase
MFKSFFRGSNTANIKGSGLGLIVAKQFTELLNGAISINSSDENTVVELEFPYHQKK